MPFSGKCFIAVFCCEYTLYCKPVIKQHRFDGELKTHNEFKECEGRLYTGMRVGRSHKWYYDQGEWRETKITSDLSEISYAVTKRRVGKAPEGSCLGWN